MYVFTPLSRFMALGIQYKLLLEDMADLKFPGVSQGKNGEYHQASLSAPSTAVPWYTTV